MLMAVYPGVLLASTLILIILKWILIGRMTPGTLQSNGPGFVEYGAL
jgi:hypothetical protein